MNFDHTHAIRYLRGLELMTKNNGVCFTASTTKDCSGENNATAANCTCWDVQ